MLVSLFSDVIGPIMRGTSSSHCAAALRIGRLAREKGLGNFDAEQIEIRGSRIEDVQRCFELLKNRPVIGTVLNRSRAGGNARYAY